MKWYKLNEDHTTEPYPEGEYPLNGEFTSRSKHVGDETINGQRVSTVFLDLDHNFMFEDPRPVLFETMIFDGEYSGEMWRYCTWDEAKEGHDRIVNCLKQGINPTQDI